MTARDSFKTFGVPKQEAPGESFSDFSGLLRGESPRLTLQPEKITYTHFCFRNQSPEKLHVSYLKYFSGTHFPKITLHVCGCDSENDMEKLFGNYFLENLISAVHKRMFSELISQNFRLECSAPDRAIKVAIAIVNFDRAIRCKSMFHWRFRGRSGSRSENPTSAIAQRRRDDNKNKICFFELRRVKWG